MTENIWSLSAYRWCSDAVEEMPEVAREGGEGKPPCTRKSLGEVRNRKWQLAEALSHRLISTVTTEKLSTCWAPAIHWDHLFSPWSFPTCRQTFRNQRLVYPYALSEWFKNFSVLIFRVANGDQKVLFPFHGDTYGFPSKSCSGRMHFLLALHHPKQRNSPFLHSSIRTKRVSCIPEELTLS